MPPAISERRKALVAKFQATTSERLAKLNRLVVEFEKHPEREALGPELLREIHTLKGDAKVMGLPDINRVAHRIEDLLAWTRERGFKLSGEVPDVLLGGLDLVGTLARISSEPPDPKALSAYLGRIDAIVGASAAPDRPVAVSPRPPQQPETSPAPVRNETSEQFVRVNTTSLGHLTSLSADLSRGHDQLERLVSDLQRINDEIMRPGAEVTAAELSKRTAALVKETRRTLAWAKDEIFDHGLKLQGLRERIREIRLRRIGELFEHYPRAVRDLAKELGKKINVVMEGADVGVDKQVLDRVDEPVLHLLRNCIDHGLEPPSDRIATGKHEQGGIWLVARPRGGEVEIEVRDDGRGIDVERVKEAAIRKGLITAQEAGELTEPAAIDLLFRPGFSTRSEITEISGRGVGLDVVKQSIERIGGSVRVETEVGRGSSFVLTVPVSTILTRVLLVQTAGGLFAFPSSSVEQVLRIHESILSGEKTSVVIDDLRLPLVDLDQLLGAPGAGGWESPELELVVVRSGARHMALRVKKILGERQAAQQALDPFLARIPLLTGSAALEGGRLVLLLSVPELFREPGRTHFPPFQQTDPGMIRRVLVVEDSQLVRDVVVSLVSRMGFDALEAVDGQDALARLSEQPPDLILTDLDMPILNGFELITRVRAMPLTKNIPIVVLSTRGSVEDQRQALSAGADAYVVKSSFQEGELKNTLDRLIASTGASKS